MATLAPWYVAAKADLGKYTDDSPPFLGRQIAAAFPGDKALASYSNGFGIGTYWCAIWIAYVFSRFGYKPPLNGTGVGAYAYVDAWENDGVPVRYEDRLPGDVALFDNPGGSSLHHIAFVAEDGKYLGGNQSGPSGDTVTLATFNVRPTSIRRITPPTFTPVEAPFSRPLLMIGSKGENVVFLQEKLIAAGFNVGPDGADGDFGDNTKLAVEEFQTRANIEVDGIVGDETWGVLLDSNIPPPPAGNLPATLVAQIITLARNDPMAKFFWPAKGAAAARGVAPIGYTCGMCVEFAEVYRDLKAGKSSAVAMVRPLGGSLDALAVYGLQPTLPNVFAFLLGLGMQESSGNYTAGRDMGAGNIDGATTEAGLFQQSWNSNVFSPEIGKLLASPPSPCYVEIFREGITPKSTPNYGSGDALRFQQLAKSCPAFAVECAGVLIRVRCDHFGPINREEVTVTTAAIAMFEKVAALVDAYPFDGEVIDPGDGDPDPAPIDKTTLVLMALLLILLKEKQMPNSPSPVDIDRALGVIMQLLTNPAAAPPALPPPAAAPAAQVPAVRVPSPDLDALIRLLGGTPPGRAEAPQEAPKTVEPPPKPVEAPKTQPTPPAAPAPSLQKPAVQAFGASAGLVALLQYLGVVGTPFGMGTEPTDVGTGLTLLTGFGTLLATTGIFGSLGTGFGKFLVSVGEYAAKYQPPKK